MRFTKTLLILALSLGTGAQLSAQQLDPASEARARELLQKLSQELEAEKETTEVAPKVKERKLFRSRKEAPAPKPEVARDEEPKRSRWRTLLFGERPPAEPKPEKVEKAAAPRPVEPPVVTAPPRTAPPVAQKPAPAPKPEGPSATVARNPEAPAPKPAPTRRRDTTELPLPDFSSDEATTPVAARPTTKQEKLEALLMLYRGDVITPTQYHSQRAKILSEP